MAKSKWTSMTTFRVLIVYTLLFILAINALDTVNPNHSLNDGDTRVSADGRFELGFFSPGSSKNRYLGIWYKKISNGTVVWVANRETPLTDHFGVLTLTDQGVLLLLNSTKDAIWSSNGSRPAQNPNMQLLESGNLVVRNGNDSDPESFIWQSFDYPSHTLLPDMKFGRNLVTGLDRFLSSWKSEDDPARGEFTFGMDPRGYPQTMIRKGSTIVYRSGPWNGHGWSGAPQLRPNLVYTFEFVSNEHEVYYMFHLRNSAVASRMVLEPSGKAQRFTWIDRTNSWSSFSLVQLDQCSTYGLCGAYGICNAGNLPLCSCLKGFTPKSPKDWSIQDWSDGCVRRTRLACDGRDGFLLRQRVKLPDLPDSWENANMSLNECKNKCTQNCSCIAYANSNITGDGRGCFLWFVELLDIREFNDGGQDLYIRLAASELVSDDVNGSKSSSRKNRVGIIAGTWSIIIGVLILGLVLCYWRKRNGKPANMENSGGTGFNDEGRKEDLELPTFDFTVISNITTNFSSANKLGEGGFGSVYKGTLPEGQEIAVKRLSQSSGQGMTEFKNEVILIAKLQHRNLVKLLGCCIERDERMLVYEYMPNKSLDCLIFDRDRRKSLDWRKCINIISGIARGLLYLHQDSRLRIIHRDLKASNVLLDDSMNPKISDFGMARAFGGDQIEGKTSKIVGTHGYMSPEYAVDGLFSAKSDVFSFGVLVLEIVSGKRNRGFNHPGHKHNLLGHSWRLWNEGRLLELIDDLLLNSGGDSELLRCIHVGLLCVQHHPEDRPNMSSVVLMLSSDINLPLPKQPGFFTERSFPKTDSSSSNQISFSTNEITFSLLEPR